MNDTHLQRCARPSRAWILCLYLILPAITWGHARFENATPAPDAVLEQAPSKILLHFNKPVQPVSVALIDASGSDLSAGLRPQAVDSDVLLDIPDNLAAGRYLVSYRVLSGDAHAIAASFSFVITGTTENDNALVAPPLQADPAPITWEPALTAVRAAYMIGLLLTAGGALFTLLVPAASEIRTSLRQGTTGLSIYTTLAAFVYLQVAGANILGSPLLPDIDAVLVAANSSLGISLGVALTGLVVLIISRAERRSLLLAGVTMLVVSRALTGHPASRESGWMLMPAMALHVACAAFWYGSLLPLYLSLKRLQPSQTARVLTEFSRAALFAVATLICMGLLMALVHLARPEALTTTWYGQLLVMKSTWFAVLFGLAAWHKLRLSPRIASGDTAAISRMRISIIFEALIMTLIILISVNLAKTSPELLAESRDGNTTVATIKAKSQTGNYSTIVPLEVSAGVSVPGLEVEALDGQFALKPELDILGTWQLHIAALVTSFDKEIFMLELSNHEQPKLRNAQSITRGYFRHCTDTICPNR